MLTAKVYRGAPPAAAADIARKLTNVMYAMRATAGIHMTAGPVSPNQPSRLNQQNKAANPGASPAAMPRPAWCGKP
ncbi:hypothetical protein [Pseudarthrobacter sp. NBSH8]|uniref:hypothetical protein n=1 Tax=Pseudarthrobacter sp. NBSH8 TaxID=2596911 RepID=UPI0016284B63|nr:hypothetical protein [Pseudarthrobacter sp. NBSH8]QNE15444.1 hypothetical protein FYJ92_14190 [Pseudarthrobacter sp. NBSH8]